MAEFKWHLMDEEMPEYGVKDYLVMGPKGSLRVARGFHQGHLGPLGAYFHGSSIWSYIIEADEVYAWAEIPPLEVDDGRG